MQVEEENKATQFDLAMDMTDFGTTFTGKLIYNTDIFAESTVNRMASHYLVCVDSLLY